MRSVLVLRRGGLGDTLLVLPTLRALRRAFPDARLAVAGVSEFVDVLRHHGAADEALSSESLATWRLGSPSDGPVRARLRRHDLVVGDDPALASLAGAGTEVRSFDVVPRSIEPFGLQLARRVGLAPLWPADAWLAPPRGSPVDGAITLAPGSGGRDKCWPRERWLALASHLDARGEQLDVVVGPSEVERDDPRRWPWPAPVRFVAGASVVELAGHLRAARVHVGNDSGTTHLAACLGVPTVALFGPTDPRVWAPPGPHVVVCTGAAGLATIEPSRVANLVADASAVHGRGIGP